MDLFIPGNDSLKGKRQVLKSLLNRMNREFQVSVSEVGDGDMWQRTRLGIATIGRGRTQVNAKFQAVREWVEASRQVEIISTEEEIISL